MYREHIEPDGKCWDKVRESCRRFYPEEASVGQVRVDPIWIDETAVTNTQFAACVADAGFVTFAKVAPNSKDFLDMAPDLVFAEPAILQMMAPLGLRKLDQGDGRPCRRPYRPRRRRSLCRLERQLHSGTGEPSPSLPCARLFP
ncbi:SUMF1/EgtB/PvdO family nonheme iron enzyme [Sphingobium sp.]|uniref:SUMF1/EgtB/PvdO family nonheme iron enzyme n=1 Tax=Sphingobium sp. TaxID=1912891 RepID=UPI0039C8EE05